MLSILSLYKFDPSIFDGLELPTPDQIPADAELIDNPPELDRETLIWRICFNLAELSLVYSDPEIMRDAIRVWAATRYYTWLRMYETLLYKYNPIWNKDGSYTETRSLQTQQQSSGSAQSSGSYSHDVTGFDRNSYAPDTQDRSTGQSAQNASGSGSEAETITRREYGNIGVTMTQDMIERQRAVVEFNLYDYIVQDFKREFCIQIY